MWTFSSCSEVARESCRPWPTAASRRRIACCSGSPARICCACSRSTPFSSPQLVVLLTIARPWRVLNWLSPAMAQTVRRPWRSSFRRAPHWLVQVCENSAFDNAITQRCWLSAAASRPFRSVWARRCCVKAMCCCCRLPSMRSGDCKPAMTCWFWTSLKTTCPPSDASLRPSPSQL